MQVVDRVSDRVSSSVDATSTQTDRLQEFLGRSWRTTCASWLALLLVAVVFFGMYIFMKIFGKPSATKFEL
jgi:hypothetical protein